MPEGIREVWRVAYSLDGKTHTALYESKREAEQATVDALEKNAGFVSRNRLPLATPEMLKVLDASVVLMGARADYKTEVIEHGQASPRATVTLGKAEENHINAVAAWVSARAARPEGT